MVKILITSGGCRIPIDPVRDLAVPEEIANMSNGTFGSRIARELLLMNQLGANNEIYFLLAVGSRSPFVFARDVRRNEFKPTLRELIDTYDLADKYNDQYHEIEYRSFEEYAALLEQFLKVEKPDITILAAAASDYGIANPHTAKIRSGDALTLQMVQLPKLIGFVKEWCPTTTLVGFKLLVGAPRKTLIQAARDSIAKNKCDLVVANDLESLRAANHIVVLVNVDGSLVYESNDHPDNPYYCANAVATAAMYAHAMRGVK